MNVCRFSFFCIIISDLFEKKKGKPFKQFKDILIGISKTLSAKLFLSFKISQGEKDVEKMLFNELSLLLLNDVCR
jgi:hypothetical protein